MEDLIEIRDVGRLSSISETLGNVYFLVSMAHGNLIRDHEAIRQCWVDERVNEFSAHFESASEYLWQLLISISNIQEFLAYAGETYLSADNHVSGL